MLGHSLVRHVDLQPPAAWRRWNADNSDWARHHQQVTMNRIGEGASLHRATTHPESHVGFEARACNHLRITRSRNWSSLSQCHRKMIPKRRTSQGSLQMARPSLSTKASQKTRSLLHNSMNLFQTESLNCGPIAAPRPYLCAQRQTCLGVNFVQFNVQSTCT